MARISLSSYLEQIKGAVEEGYLDEALVHCRRILEQYPQHLDTYRQLGATLLRRGEYEDAIDVFERVLNADPEDAVAHRGLAAGYRASGRLPEAGWHHQRATEIQPYAEVELDDWPAQAGWSEEAGVRRPTLTRAALARIHVKGGMYPQAIAYLRSAMSSRSSRPDLQVLLAEALWRNGQRMEAVQVSRELLARLPNCVKANAIVAGSLIATEQVDEARRHLAKVQAALLLEQDDLENGTGLPVTIFRSPGAPPLAEQVMVQALELSHAQTRQAEAIGPEWLSRIGKTDIDAFDGPDLGQSSAPEWLPAFQLAGARDADKMRSQPAPAVEQVAVHRADSLPEVNPANADLAPEPEHALEHNVVAVGLVGMAVHEAAAAEHEPGSLAEEPTMSGNESSADARAKGSAEQDPDELKATLAWLEVLAARQGVSIDELSVSGEPSGVEDSAEQYPDWLTKDLSDIPTGAEIVAAPGVESGSAEEIPGWLRDSVEIPAETATPPPATGDELDDLGWLDQIAAGAGEAIDEPPTLSWQKSEQGASEADDALSWLDGITKPIAAAAVVRATESGGPESAPTTPSEGTGTQVGEAPEDVDEAIAWLEQLAARQGAPLEELPTVAASGASTEFEPSIPEKDDADAAVMASLDDVPDDLEAAQLLLGATLVGTRAGSEEAGQSQVVDAVQPAAEIAGDAPNDPDEVLTWLEKLAAQQIAERAAPPSTEPIQVVIELDTPAVPHDVMAAAAIAATVARRETPEDVEGDAELDSVEDLLASIPDDPDAAMLWLEQLAARQVASHEGLPVEQAGEEVMAWPVDVEQEIADEMPDWLALEAPAEPADSLPDDLSAAWEADQADFAAWLAGETGSRVEEPVLTPSSVDEGGLPIISDEIEPAPAEETADEMPSDRASLVARYERDVARGDNIEGVLQSLKALVMESAEPDPAITLLLGDAYAQTGDLASALDAYGDALDML